MSYKTNIRNTTRAKGLENAIIVSILLFLFNLVFPEHDSLLLSLINEVLVFLVLFFVFSYVQPFLSTKTDSPLTLVLNAGILAALIFAIISISNSLFGSFTEEGARLNIFNSLFSIILIFVFIATLIYIFASFRELFFLRQKKDPRIYFNTMQVFFAFTFFSNLLFKIDKNFDYPYEAFYVVSIVLISLNSLRVSWIAFLVKKQKLYLLIISTILSLLFAFNFGLLLSETNTIRQIIVSFSPGLYTIFSLTMIYGVIYFGVIFFTTLFHLPTAEAFDRKAEEASSLMDLTKLITQVFDFKELADSITSTTNKVCNSHSSWLVTKKENEYQLNSVNNISYVEADNLTKILLDTEEVELQRVQTIYFDSVSVELKNEMKEFKSIAIAPLKVHGNINGFLITARYKDVNFDEDEKKSLQAFADYAAVALENAKLIAESIEKERLEKELDVARDIQKKILPEHVPYAKEFQVAALFVPAFEVGGDYYDFFQLDDNKIGFIVADVSGKGISASFIMAEVKGIFESLSKLISNPRELLIKVNDILKNSLDKKSFVTVIYGILNKETGILNFARAGHTPVLLCSGNELERIQPPGIGIGLDYSIGFANTLKEMQIVLKNDDIVAFYSDGIPEAKNAQNEDFGYERFENIILQNKDKSLDEITSVLMHDLTLFSKDHSQHDDITLVLIKWTKKN
ncbi:MAG: PP2C family protein-serine/threonine phosphatase [Melioribacteraceae bacterium]|nr:PP2C family protein-serine/threonine phosphatase [Melioribacteraceae bacterium]